MRDSAAVPPYGWSAAIGRRGDDRRRWLDDGWWQGIRRDGNWPRRLLDRRGLLGVRSFRWCTRRDGRIRGIDERAFADGTDSGCHDPGSLARKRWRRNAARGDLVAVRAVSNCSHYPRARLFPYPGAAASARGRKQHGNPRRDLALPGMDCGLVAQPTSEALIAALASRLTTFRSANHAADRFPAGIVEILRRLGILAAPLPRSAGGAGWGTETAGVSALCDALRMLGYTSLAAGRIFEAHVNALA